MKLIFRILGIILGLLILLVGIGAAFVNFSAQPTYAEVDIPELNLAPDSAQIALGAKLTLMNCQGCHMTENGVLEGKKHIEKAADALGNVYAANITQDPVHGIGSYTEGELYRLLRTGIKRDGSLSIPIMPRNVVASDEDIHAIIAYLKYGEDKAVQPSAKEKPAFKPSFLGKALFQFAWKPEAYPENPHKALPPMADSVGYGKYLVESRYYCYVCHSGNPEKLNLRQPELSEGYLQGGYVFKLYDYDIQVPSIYMYGDSEIGKWSIYEFVAAVKWGQRPSGKPYREPMHPYTMLDTAEVRTIYHYLKSYHSEKSLAGV